MTWGAVRYRAEGAWVHLETALNSACRLLRPALRVKYERQLANGSVVLLVKVRGMRRALGPMVVVARDSRRAYQVVFNQPQELHSRDLEPWLREAGLAGDDRSAAGNTWSRPVLDDARLRQLWGHFGDEPLDSGALRALGVMALGANAGVATRAAAIALSDSVGVELGYVVAGFDHAEATGVGVVRVVPCVGGLDEVLGQVRTAAANALGDTGAPALREVLLNAIVHRSYAPEDVERPVRVELYTDAVRVISPGPMLERVRQSDSALPKRAWCRNATLQGFLQALGHVSGRGFGFAALAEGGHGLRPVRVQHTRSSVAVLLRPSASAAMVPPAPRRRGKSELGRDSIVSLVKVHGPLGRSQLEDLLGLSRPRVSQLLAGLVKEGRVVPEEAARRSRHQRYRLP
jgi:hypothetical protein